MKGLTKAVDLTLSTDRVSESVPDGPGPRNKYVGRMHVVLDSTALIADFSLTSAANRGLLEASKRGFIKLAVPELVLLEVVHKWRERVTKVSDAADAVLKDARRLGLEDLQIAVPSVHEKSVDYENALRTKLMESKALILSIPDTSHEVLVVKAIQRMAPFADKGTGYRDALIWESVKGVLRADPHEAVVFVTANKADFGSSDTGIRQGLLDELKSESISHDRISVVDSPAAAAAETLEHAQRLLDLLTNKLDSDEVVREAFFEQVVETADLDIRHIGEQRYSPDRHIRFLDVTDLYKVNYFEAVRSWLISSGRIGVEFEAEADADVNFEYEIDTPSYYYDPRRDRGTVGAYTESGTVTASMSGQLEFEESTGEITLDGVSIWQLSEPRMEL